MLRPLTITATTDANLYVHWNADGNCTISFECATGTAICVTCASIEDCDGVPGGSAYEGAPCDDQDPTTYDDAYIADCECVGIPYECAELLANIGDACDDGNPLTAFDIVNEDCECIGELGFSQASAIPITCSNESVTYSSLNSNATKPVISCSESVANNGLYFSFIGTGNPLIVHTSSYFKIGVQIYNQSEGQVNCSSGAFSYSTIYDNTIVGETYYVYIAHYYKDSSKGNLTIELMCRPIPDNNDCENAALLTCGEVVEGSTISATTPEIDYPECVSYISTPDVYYSLDVIEGYEYTVSVNAIAWVETILIYSGDCNSLIIQECSEQHQYNATDHTVVFTPELSETLIIRIYFDSPHGL